MNTNQQPVEGTVHTDGSIVVVHSIFNTIQGEGPLVGRPAVFVRLAGCNLQCPMCDTEYTDKRTQLSTGAICAYVLDEMTSTADRLPLVVITGGEPFRQPIGRLCRALLRQGHTVQVETNGTLYRDDLPYNEAQFFIVCSPKIHRVHPKLVPYICAFKYVGACDTLADDDGLPLQALGHPCKSRLFRPPLGCFADVFLQPVDEQDPARNEKNLKAVIQSCLRHNYRLCLQTHKIIGLA